MIAARVRIRNAWVDAHIRNVSSRGMMIDLQVPVSRGTYIEISRKEWRTAARVAWSESGLCGIQTQDRVHLPELASAKGRTMRASDLAETVRAAKPGASWMARSVGRLVEMGVLIAVVAGAALFIAESLHDSLAATVGRVVANL
jgi:hypothetical protein